jgi:hypothetical protein
MILPYSFKLAKRGGLGYIIPMPATYADIRQRIHICSHAELPRLLKKGQFGAVIGLAPKSALRDSPGGKETLAFIQNAGIEHQSSCVFHIEQKHPHLECVSYTDTYPHIFNEVRDSLIASEKLFHANDKRIAICCDAGRDRSALYAAVLIEKLIRQTYGPVRIYKALNLVHQIQPAARLWILAEDHFARHFGHQYPVFKEAVRQFRAATSTAARLKQNDCFDRPVQIRSYNSHARKFGLPRMDVQ